MAGPAGGVPARETDVNELAARLDSPIIFDRRGSVLFMDDFESGISKWNPVAGTIEWSAERAKHGGFSVKMTNAAPGTISTITRRSAYPVQPSYIGLSASILLHTNAFAGLYLSLTGTGGQRWIAQLVIYPANLFIFNGPNAISLSVGPFITGAANYMFHQLKVVANLNDKRLIRAIVDGTEYDISRFVPQIIASGDNTSELLYSVYGDSTVGSSYLYVDSVILTKDEPV